MKAVKFIVNGAVFSGAAFRCETFEIASCEISEVARILCSDMKVKYRPRGDVPEIEAGSYILSSYFIDAQNAELEYVYADKVECENAYIGPCCRIGELVYRNDIEIDPGSVVERLYRI